MKNKIDVPGVISDKGLYYFNGENHSEIKRLKHSFLLDYLKPRCKICSVEKMFLHFKTLETIVTPSPPLFFLIILSPFPTLPPKVCQGQAHN